MKKIIAFSIITATGIALFSLIISCKRAQLQTANNTRPTSDINTPNANQQPINDTLHLLSKKWMLNKSTINNPKSNDGGTISHTTDYTNSLKKEFLILSFKNMTYSVGVNQNDTNKDSLIINGTWDIKNNFISFNPPLQHEIEPYNNGLTIVTYVKYSDWKISQLDTANLVLFYSQGGRVGGIGMVQSYKPN